MLGNDFDENVKYSLNLTWDYTRNFYHPTAVGVGVSKNFGENPLYKPYSLPQLGLLHGKHVPQYLDLGEVAYKQATVLSPR